MNLSRKSKIAVGFLLIAATAAYFVFNYAYKPHKTVDDREVKFTGTVADFNKKVAEDVAAWQDVVVELTGKVTSKDKNGFTLDGNAFCQTNTAENPEIEEGKTLTIKARMIGYDDLLEEIKLDQTKIIK